MSKRAAMQGANLSAGRQLPGLLCAACCRLTAGHPPRAATPSPPPPPCCLGCLLALLLQIFEVYGLGREVIDTAFAGTVSRIGGMSLADIQREGEAFWAKGFPSEGLTKLDDYGFIQSRPKGEYHANNQVCRCCRWGVAGVGGLGLGLLAW